MESLLWDAIATTSYRAYKQKARERDHTGLDPMQRLEFRAKGLTRSTLRKWRRRTAAGVAMKMLIAAAVTVAAANYVESVAPIEDIVRAKILLVVTDVSGSMDDDQATLQAQRERLRAKGIAEAAEKQVMGFGVAVLEDSTSNLLTAIAEGLGQHPEVDAVFTFSDFDVVDAPYWISNGAGYERLERLLRSNRARLYLVSVVNDPSPELVKLAQRSGGGVIRNARDR